MSGGATNQAILTALPGGEDIREPDNLRHGVSSGGTVPPFIEDRDDFDWIDFAWGFSPYWRAGDRPTFTEWDMAISLIQLPGFSQLEDDASRDGPHDLGPARSSDFTPFHALNTTPGER